MILRPVVVLGAALALLAAGRCTAPGGAPGQEGFCRVENGVLLSPEGTPLSLWGVNFQTPLSWESGRLAKVGVPITAEGLNGVTDRNLDDVVKMEANLLRCHLTPADFTDENGSLVETLWLDALDYLVCEAGKRGLYLSFAFLNHMGKDGPGAKWAGKGAETWLLDSAVIACTRNYMVQLLNHPNKYDGVLYKDAPQIAYWELINEPLLYSREDIRETPYDSLWHAWLRRSGEEDNAESFSRFREERVRTYIDESVDALRTAGDRHPVCWGLNWHRFRRDNADIFRGAAASRADLVACCNYPGQDSVAQNYTRFRYDLTDRSFRDWFNRYAHDPDGYGWTTETEFAGKAVVIYEFETFFNQSAWMYPCQALYFKSLRGQAATMWTYTFAEIAEWFGGSHYLNLRTTPAKAASFIVARHIFASTPLGTPVTMADEMKGENWCISRSHDAAVYSDADWYCHSGETASGWSGLEPSPTVRHIRGVGDSPLVHYTGNGLYFIDIQRDSLTVELLPDVQVVGDPFFKPDYLAPVTLLDGETAHDFVLRLPGTGTELFRTLKPGKYTFAKP